MSNPSKLRTVHYLQPQGGTEQLLVLCVILFLSCLTQRADHGHDFGPVSERSELSLQGRFAEVDKALFMELVKLAKFNVHFHLEANRQQGASSYSSFDDAVHDFESVKRL